MQTPIAVSLPAPPSVMFHCICVISLPLSDLLCCLLIFYFLQLPSVWHLDPDHNQPPLQSPLKKSCSKKIHLNQPPDVMLFDWCPLKNASALLVTHKQNTSSVNVNWPPCGITHVCPADYKRQFSIISGFVSKRVFLGWRKTHFVVSLFFAVLIEPVVEGVAVTGFLFFLTPTQYYQQCGDSTQEVSSWNLKMKQNRLFTPIYLADRDSNTAHKPPRAASLKNISILFIIC